MAYECLACNYLWESKKRIGSPAKCPSCNSRNITFYIPPPPPPPECILCKKVINYSLFAELWIYFQKKGCICIDCLKDILQKGDEDDKVCAELRSRLPFIDQEYNDYLKSERSNYTDFPVLLEPQNHADSKEIGDIDILGKKIVWLPGKSNEKEH